MARMYKALSCSLIAQGSTVAREARDRKINLSLNDPAMYVMTDFNIMPPFAIGPTASIDAANAKMIASGIRMLFVTGSDGTLFGIVTANDVLGEKPVRYLHEHSGTREDIMTQDIMTPHSELQALKLLDVEMSTVGDVIETMKKLQRQHVLVVETSETKSGESIRGLFSSTQITRQTGVEIPISERANSFADIERVIASS
ncbi:CBS domain-containing protein [Pseudomonadota bacterium]